MVTRTHLSGQDLDAPSTDVTVHRGTVPGAAADQLAAASVGRLAMDGASYAAARAALDAALPAGWRRAAVETLPADRVALAAESDLGGGRGVTADRPTAA